MRKVKRRKTSDGTRGEELFLYLANNIGWHMTRIQPPTRYVNTPTGFKIIPIGGKDDPKPPDYVGWTEAEKRFPLIIWCEVKECKEDTMPASRLSKCQRLFMDTQPKLSTWVCVVWIRSTITVEMFPYKSEGSYQLGTGFFARNI